MIAFSRLAEALLFEPAAAAREVHLAAYLAAVPVADGAAALGLLTGRPGFAPVRPAAVKALAGQLDPVLFALSRRFVGDSAETVALMWPAGDEAAAEGALRLGEAVGRLAALRAGEAADGLAALMAGLDAGARRTLLLMATGRLKVSVTTGAVAGALARLGHCRAETLLPLLTGPQPPFAATLAFARGEGERPAAGGAVLPPPVALDAGTFDWRQAAAGWLWDGLTVLLRLSPSGCTLTGPQGEDLTAAFPECAGLAAAAPSGGAALIVADLTAGRDGRAEPGLWRSRLERRGSTAAGRRAAPMLLRAFDMLAADGTDLRAMPLAVRRSALERLAAAADSPHLAVSPVLAAAGGRDGFAALRAGLPAAGEAVGHEAAAIAGLRLTRPADGWQDGQQPWRLWPREPSRCLAVLMYGERGPGRGEAGFRQITVGVWRGAELVPVGQIGAAALAAAAPDALEAIAAFVRTGTTGRFGPVREVVHTAAEGLVLRIGFAALDPAPRRKAGFVLRGAVLDGVEPGCPPPEAARLEDLAG